MTGFKLSLIFFFSSIIIFAQNKETSEFETLVNEEHWKLAFSDNGSNEWESKWFLDGLRANVRNTDNGMVFSAGAVAGDDSCHAVLWTNTSFTADVKIGA